jgi:tRNA threonylcarbamoyladenosine biosynthesis protein TsaE
MEFIYNLNEIETIAQQVIDQNPQKVILFNGLMGVGKSFIKKTGC